MKTIYGGLTMKFKITRKELRDNYRVVNVPYCELQHLLRYCSPIAYNAGVYGWNYDVYDFTQYSTNIAICTGYRCPPGIFASRDTYAKYEDEAKAIVYGGDVPYDQFKEKLDCLIRSLLDELENKYFSKQL